MNFEKKYEPKKLDDIIGNHYIIKEIEEWINSFDETTQFLNKNNLLKKTTKGRKKKIINETEREILLRSRKANLMIYGDHGVGKSILTKLIFEKMNLKVFKITENMKEDIDINLINKIIQKNDYYEENQNKIILIDKYEKIISSNNKKEILNIIKYNNFKRLVPIIILSNNEHNSNLTNLKKNVNLIEMYYLNLDNIKKWMINICFEENIHFENKKIQEKIIKNCKFNMKKILFSLEILKKMYDEMSINENNVDELFSILKNKDYNNSLFNVTLLLLKNDYNINNCIELFNMHKMILSLMIYENYYKFCNISCYENIIKNFMTGDLIENYIHSEHNWDLNILHSLISCAIPIYYISNNQNNKNEKINYPYDLNKTTIKKKNDKKKTKNSISENYYYKNKSIEELLYLEDIFN